MPGRWAAGFQFFKHQSSVSAWTLPRCRFSVSVFQFSVFVFQAIYTFITWHTEIKYNTKKLEDVVQNFMLKKYVKYFIDCGCGFYFILFSCMLFYFLSMYVVFVYVLIKLYCILKILFIVQIRFNRRKCHKKSYMSNGSKLPTILNKEG